MYRYHLYSLAISILSFILQILFLNLLFIFWLCLWLFFQAEIFNFKYSDLSFFSFMSCLFYVIFRKAFPLVYLKFSLCVPLNYFKLSQVKIGLKLEKLFSDCYSENRWEFPSWLSRLRNWLVSTRMHVWSLASLSGLRIWGCRELDPMLLWLWCRPVAIAPIRPLPWEFPYVQVQP